MDSAHPKSSDASADEDRVPTADSPGSSNAHSVPAVRAAVGGTLMGLANLVPGISGGTMLLAAGIYPEFVQGIAEVTTFRFRRTSIVLLGIVVGSAVLAIGAFAGPVKNLVVEHRPLMYSLFIGLTLGGVPVVWQLVRKPPCRGVWIGAMLGFLPMALLAWQQMLGTEGSADYRDGFLFMLLAGTAGASAMILPGVSGGYILLVLGVYVPVLAAIDALKEALKSMSLAAATAPLVDVVVPVAVGVVLGVVGVSNLLRYVLARHSQTTYGVLLGLLAGAVVGLWPFQRGVAPAVGDRFKGVIVTAESLRDIDPAKYPTEFFSPAAGDIAISVLAILIGFAATSMIARFGRAKPSPSTDGAAHVR